MLFDACPTILGGCDAGVGAREIRGQGYEGREQWIEGKRDQEDGTPAAERGPIWNPADGCREEEVSRRFAQMVSQTGADGRKIRIDCAEGRINSQGYPGIGRNDPQPQSGDLSLTGTRFPENR
jgi:hypothetical protein